jgi:hypothetical protein
MLDHQIDLVGDFASKGYFVGDEMQVMPCSASSRMVTRRRPSILRELATRDSVRLAETLFALGNVAPSWKI